MTSKDAVYPHYEALSHSFYDPVITYSRSSLAFKPAIHPKDINLFTSHFHDPSISRKEQGHHLLIRELACESHATQHLFSIQQVGGGVKLGIDFAPDVEEGSR